MTLLGADALGRCEGLYLEDFSTLGRLNPLEDRIHQPQAAGLKLRKVADVVEPPGHCIVVVVPNQSSHTGGNQAILKPTGHEQRTR